MKRTLVLGTSPKAERYSNKAVRLLREKGHFVYAYGPRDGAIADVEISQKWPEGVFDTITLYLNPNRQKEYYDRIIELKPNRVIFNPGTENQEFQQMLRSAGIPFEEACTLVLLRIGAY